MTWFKVDDHLHTHPKVLEAGNSAIGLWVRAGSWSAQQLTSGFIPTKLARQYGSAKDIRTLVDTGLWLRVEGGYRFHDWSDFQPSDEEVADLRRKRSEAGKAGAAKRWGRDKTDSKSHSKPIASAIASEVANGVAKRCPDPGPASSGLGSQSPNGRSEQRPMTDGVDLTKIAALLGSDLSWAQRVVHDVRGRAPANVRDPQRYVEAAIRERPQDYRPTPTAPPISRLCFHGRDQLTCPDCAKEETA